MNFGKNLKKIERKWQKKWKKNRIFESNINKKRSKFFITFPMPYVNGSVHIGAAFTALRCDVYARFKRTQGFNVLFPQAFHATGEPILGVIERLKKNDKTQIDTMKLYGATDKDIKAFVKHGAEYTAKYWMKKWVEDLISAGFSIDWRRTFITTPITPTYSRFVEWQYNTLRKKGYVIQGTHPVIWCPHCQSPTGDHDRLKGEGESPIEYILIKFRLDSDIVPCGTLRPETVYGVTNLWVNPDVEYVRAKVNNETWIISKEAVEKLKEQLKKVEIVGRVKGSSLVGKYCENPVTNNKIIILPAAFCDPNAASGIVMSVPSHAPYDWVGLQDLKSDVKPISIINTPGFGNHPATEICKQMNIRNQNDKEKLDRATNILYKKEFHQGVLKENCGKYSGMKVSECKDMLSKELHEKGVADSIWESTALVYCRCTTLNHVKILENQWFLKYSDEEWKEKVRNHMKEMRFYPEDARVQFENTVNWLKDKACTRRAGLGTPLPWDNEWKIETLSDSTIYMAYYTLARIINEMKITADKLTDEVLDYILLGRGDSKQLSRKTKFNQKIMEEMRKEFDYFYPVDVRNSAKELVQNHLTFYIFHHTAVWDDKKYWPKGIGVNGFVNVSGTKMSKSKGNIIPIKDLIKAVGADLVRINIVASNEGLNDADWRDESLSGYESRIRLLFDLVSKLKNMKGVRSGVDKFLISRIQEHVKSAKDNYEVMKFRSATQAALFDATNDVKWYVDRCRGIKNCNKKVLSEVLGIIVRLIAPLVPHTAEELWGMLKMKGFVSVSSWPEYEEKKIDKSAMEAENVLKKVMEDLGNVMKITGRKSNLYLYAMDEEVKELKDAEEFIKKRFGFKKITVFSVRDKKKYDPQNKSSKAKPGKPGIYLE